jgi:uncharacterized protein
VIRFIVALMALCRTYPVVSGTLRLTVITPEITAMLACEAQAFEASNNSDYPNGSFLETAAENMRVCSRIFCSSGSAFRDAALTPILHVNRVPRPSPIRLLGGLCYWISRPALMMIYVLLIVRLAQDQRWPQRLASFGAAGRMPLTNYPLQTALCTTIFSVRASACGAGSDRPQDSCWARGSTRRWPDRHPADVALTRTR